MIWALEAARPSMTPLRQRPAFITVGLATEEETGRHLDEIAQAGPGVSSFLLISACAAHPAN